jgi:hypothetical protein
MRIPTVDVVGFRVPSVASDGRNTWRHETLETHRGEGTTSDRGGSPCIRTQPTTGRRRCHRSWVRILVKARPDVLSPLGLQSGFREAPKSRTLCSRQKAAVPAGLRPANKERLGAKRPAYAVRPRGMDGGPLHPMARASIPAGRLGGFPPKPPSECSHETLRVYLGPQFPQVIFRMSRFVAAFRRRAEYLLPAMLPPASPLRGVLSRSGPPVPVAEIRRSQSRGHRSRGSAPGPVVRGRDPRDRGDPLRRAPGTRLDPWCHSTNLPRPLALLLLKLYKPPRLRREDRQ